MKLLTKSYFSTMNNKRLLPYLVLLTALACAACRGPEAKDVSTSSTPISLVANRHAENEKYLIDRKESVVTYKGSMAIASKGSHIGYVYVSKGELTVEKGHLTGGAVEMDMNTILDDAHRNDNNLIDHLKSADFFEVEKFPYSVFAITKVVSNGETINVTGNLTIKGITHTVIFPAHVEVKDGVVYASGKLSIDRTKWDVVYKSGKILGVNLADDLISDTIEFDVKIVARKYQ